MNKKLDREYKTMTILAVWKFALPTIIFVGFLGSTIFGKKEDPLDTCLQKSQGIIEHVYITDSTYNGFRVVYATKHMVCPKRLDEIMFRRHIRNEFNRMKKEIPLLYNGDMLDVDIYDFAEVVVKYEIDPEIVIHNIFVHGKEKVNLYAAFNPDILNSATWINPETEQGVQYLSSRDVYERRAKENRIYRYWKCHATSNTDERFCHFSEWERIK